MTPQEHADLLAAYNASQNQLAADRQVLEDATATSIASACTEYDVTGLLADLQQALTMSIVDSKHRSALSSTIGVLNLLNNVTAPVPVDPEPES